MNTIQYVFGVTLVAAISVSAHAAQDFPLFVQPATGECCQFPTSQRPTTSYLEGMRRFGANRSGGRLHAACDLYRPSAGEEIKAVSSGRVIRGLYSFYQGTYAIEVRNDSGQVVRYGEVNGRRASGIVTGARIAKGAVVGYMGKVNSGCCSPMLHFELYAGTKSGSLSQPSGRYRRRSDLLNPTDQLQAWEATTFGTSYNQGPNIADTNEEHIHIRPIAPLAPKQIRLHSVGGLSVREQSLRTTLLAMMEKKSIAAISAEFQQQGLLINAPMAEEDKGFDSESGRVGSTGILQVLQSKNSNSNLRRLRAQYVGSKKKSLRLQHLSYEVPPMELAEMKKSVEQMVEGLNSPEFASDDFVQWRLPKGYVLWIKRLNAEDMADHPFFTYSESDKGSLRITVELDPHS